MVIPLSTAAASSNDDSAQNAAAVVRQRRRRRGGGYFNPPVDYCDNRSRRVVVPEKSVRGWPRQLRSLLLIVVVSGAVVTQVVAVDQAFRSGGGPNIRERNDDHQSQSVADMLMSQLFGNTNRQSLVQQSLPDSTACQIEYTDILGGDLNDGRAAGQQTKSPKQCQKKCQDTPGCNFFSWDRFAGYCWLKRGDGLRIPHPKMIIGPKFCASMVTNAHTPTPKEPCTVVASQPTCDLSSPYQTFTGQCNNVNNPNWGAAHTPFVRLVPPDYAPENLPRGIGKNMPSVRSVTAAFPEVDNPDGRIASMMMQFGQFLDHDISNTMFPEKHCCVTPDRPECFNIIVPSSDQTYRSRHNSSATCIDFSRSSPACGLNSREQVNTVTSFLDASMVYGSDNAVANRIRAHKGGRLLENDHKPGHLPTKLQLKRPSNFIDDRMEFIAGDLRVNEQPFLTSMHVLFMREHNRLAKMLQTELETDNDELLYQSARKLLITEFQNIVYKEFLPLLLGERFVNIYKLDVNSESQYNPNTNPTAINEFASAAMRFGHSMINSLFKVITHEEIFLRLRDIFNAKMFNGNHMLEIEPMILGLLNQNAQKVDGSFANEVTNHLFEEHSPRAQTEFGGDLVARNIQRARDHGVPGYNHYRKICNLQPIGSFKQKPLEISTDMWKRFQSLYKSVDDIDLFPGAMAERPVDPDALLGPTFSCIIGLQFHNLKYGDRFFFTHHNSNLNYLSKYIKEMESRSLSDIICDNTDIVRVQQRAMESPLPDNPIVECSSRRGQNEDNNNTASTTTTDSLVAAAPSSSPASAPVIDSQQQQQPQQQPQQPPPPATLGQIQGRSNNKPRGRGRSAGPRVPKRLNRGPPPPIQQLPQQLPPPQQPQQSAPVTFELLATDQLAAPSFNSQEVVLLQQQDQQQQQDLFTLSAPQPTFFDALAIANQQNQPPPPPLAVRNTGQQQQQPIITNVNNNNNQQRGRLIFAEASAPAPINFGGSPNHHQQQHHQLRAQQRPNGGGSKPVRFIEIFQEEDAITSP